MSGQVELYHNGNCVQSRWYHTKADRSRLIYEWYKLYRLDKKQNVYFQISYLSSTININYAR